MVVEKNFTGVRWTSEIVSCIVFLNRAVGETFRSVVCWGEDSEPHKNRREAPKADAPVRF